MPQSPLREKGWSARTYQNPAVGRSGQPKNRGIKGSFYPRRIWALYHYNAIALQFPRMVPAPVSLSLKTPPKRAGASVGAISCRSRPGLPTARPAVRQSAKAGSQSSGSFTPVFTCLNRCMRLYGKPLLRNAEKFMISFWKELSWRFGNADGSLEWGYRRHLSYLRATSIRLPFKPERTTWTTASIRFALQKS